MTSTVAAAAYELLRESNASTYDREKRSILRTGAD